MANTDIAQQLFSFLQGNPGLVDQFVQHPYSMTQEVTGADERLSRTDMSEVMCGVASLAAGGADLAGLAGMAGALLSQNGGSVHQLAGALFGGGGAQGGGGLDLASLASAASGLLSGGIPAGIDLSDGIGLDDLAGLAGGLFGKK